MPSLRKVAFRIHTHPPKVHKGSKDTVEDVQAHVCIHACTYTHTCMPMCAQTCMLHTHPGTHVLTCTQNNVSSTRIRTNWKRRVWLLFPKEGRVIEGLRSGGDRVALFSKVTLGRWTMCVRLIRGHCSGQGMYAELQSQEFLRRRGGWSNAHAGHVHVHACVCVCICVYMCSHTHVCRWPVIESWTSR